MGACMIFSAIKIKGSRDGSFPVGFRDRTGMVQGVKPPEADDMY